MWFFFYGTLAECFANRVTRAIRPVLEYRGKATVRGRLFAVKSSEGYYPALQPGSGRVHGHLYKAGPSFRPRHLRMLDRYELYDPLRPVRSEYLRRAAKVRLPKGPTRLAEVYWYNLGSCPWQTRVVCGDFASFARRRRLRVYGDGS